MEETSSLTTQFSVVLSGIAVALAGFFYDKLKEHIKARRLRRKENPIFIAKKDAQVDELLIQIRVALRADSAALWQKDKPEADQVKYSVTHEKPARGIATFRDESQNVLQYDINNVFLKLRQQGVVQIQAEQESPDWKINAIMQSRALHDVLLAFVAQKDHVMGFIWLSYHKENLPDISDTDRETFKQYARQMAFLLTEL